MEGDLIEIMYESGLRDFLQSVELDRMRESVLKDIIGVDDDEEEELKIGKDILMRSN